MIAEGGEEAEVIFTEEDQALLAILRRKQKVAGDGDRRSGTEEASTLFFVRDNIATYAHPTKGTDDIHVLVSMTPNRSSEWIVDSDVS